MKLGYNIDAVSVGLFEPTTSAMPTKKCRPLPNDNEWVAASNPTFRTLDTELHKSCSGVNVFENLGPN
jgi:hypothetical protein